MERCTATSQTTRCFRMKFRREHEAQASRRVSVPSQASPGKKRKSYLWLSGIYPWMVRFGLQFWMKLSGAPLTHATNTTHAKPSIFWTVLLFAALCCAIPARAQDNYEIQVYGSELVDPGHTMVELHSNFTINGFKTVIDGVYPDNHAEHETVEITHGFNDYFECGFYIFTAIHNGQGFDWVGDHIRPRFAIPKKWHWPVGL